MTNIVEMAANTPAPIEMLDGRVLTEKELSMLHQLNKEFFYIVLGSKHRIMTFKPCPIDGVRMTFEQINDFYRYFEHEEKVANKNQGVAWFKWPGKTFYKNGLGYYPDETKLPKSVFNTFQGFGCKPIKGDVTLILQLVRDGLCSGDEMAFTYFIQWLAHIFQKPSQKPTVAVLMKSAEGTGKGTLFKLLKKMLGTNAYQVNGSYQLTGRFNGVIAKRLLIFGDEVDMTDKGVYDRAKGIISEDTISLELKGIDPEPIPNLARFIFAGNHDQIIRAGSRERRFLVLEPSTQMIENQQYWDKVNHQIDNGGDTAFMDYLLSLDISDFNPYKAPATQGLINEKVMSLSGAQGFIYSELTKERPFSNAARLFATQLVSDYLQWSFNNNSKPSPPKAQSQVGKMMKNLGIESQGRSGRGQGKYYELPELDILQTTFAKLLGHEKDDLF